MSEQYDREAAAEMTKRLEKAADENSQTPNPRK